MDASVATGGSTPPQGGAAAARAGEKRAGKTIDVYEGRNVLLVGHGSAHNISPHHNCFPISIRDIAEDRVHTVDIDAGCLPTFVADASSPLAAEVLPRDHYDSVVTMHAPYSLWLSETRGDPVIKQGFFRNVHGSLRDGGRLVLELPATALAMMVVTYPVGDGSPPTPPRSGRRVNKRKRTRFYDAGSWRVSCERAAKFVEANASWPGSGDRLFEVFSVEPGYCVLTKKRRLA